MKKKFYALTIVAALFGTTPTDAAESCTQQSKSSNKSNKEMKTLVVCYSATGTTKAVAQRFAKLADADFYEIKPQKAYSSADLNWRDPDSRCCRENGDPASRPALADHNARVESYDVIFVGYPIWWGAAPRVVNSFLESYDFGGKTVVPFATSGGSPIGNAAEYLGVSCPSTTTFRRGKLFGGRPSDSELTSWLDSLK